MWTSATLTTTLLWDDLLWWVSATWQDDAESEPTVISKQGRVPAHGADAPFEILTAAMIALEHDISQYSAPPAP